MARKRKTVAALAAEARIDTDDALITLWDKGFDELKGPQSFVPGGQLNRARRALGLATRRELTSWTYWCELFELDDKGLEDLLAALGVPPRKSTKRLPPKSASRLRSEAKRRGIDPVTGGDYHKEEPPQDDDEDLPWRTPGHRREIRYLTEQEVEQIHNSLIMDFRDAPDPISPGGVRDRTLLGCAVFRPLTALGEELKYPTVELAGAALLHALIHDHPFHNGNKRTALVALLAFLDENGFFPECSEDELFKLVVQVAKHRIADSASPDTEVLAIADWICGKTRITEHGARPVPWRRLKQILRDYGCEFQSAKVGNRLNITRVVTSRSRWLGRRREDVLATQVHYPDDGREAHRSVIQRIRRDLRLDDEHGVDTHAFYRAEGMEVEYFIARYRKTLKRLARL